MLTFVRIQNFASIRNVYSAKLKNLKESQKPGKAPAPAPTTSPGTVYLPLTIPPLLTGASLCRRCIPPAYSHTFEQTRSYLHEKPVSDSFGAFSYLYVLTALPFSAETYYPIIMISSSPTALITMHNVKRFLEESMYAVSFSPHFLTRSLTSWPPHPPPSHLSTFTESS